MPGPFLTYLLVRGPIGLDAVPLLPLMVLGPTALGTFACIAILITGKPRASAARVASSHWDGDVGPKPRSGADRAWLAVVPVIIVFVLLALGACLLCFAPFGPG